MWDRGERDRLQSEAIVYRGVLPCNRRGFAVHRTSNQLCQEPKDRDYFLHLPGKLRVVYQTHL